MRDAGDAGNFEIIALKSGGKSLRCLDHRETFHPVVGPEHEAELLHVQQQRIVPRAQAKARFVIWDVGLGAAANALAAVRALSGSGTAAEIHSFDKSTRPLHFALAHGEELGYLAGFEAELGCLLAEGRVSIGSRIAWHFHLGDFRRSVESPAIPAPDAIFYDPYSPIGNAEMWTLDGFRVLRSKLEDGRPCLLTNYTCSTAVRVSLLLAGFAVGHGCGVGEKRETTIASNHWEGLVKPLGRDWLERVRRSSNAAPLRTASYTTSPINEADYAELCALPQFRL